VQHNAISHNYVSEYGLVFLFYFQYLIYCAMCIDDYKMFFFLFLSEYIYIKYFNKMSKEVYTVKEGWVLKRGLFSLLVANFL